MISLYESEMIHQDDSIIMIINEQYSESLEKRFNVLNMHNVLVFLLLKKS